MRKLFNKKGELAYIEIDITVQNTWNDSISFKTLGINDSPLWLIENIILQIKKTKSNEPLGNEDGDVQTIKGKKYRLILKEI